MPKRIYQNFFELQRRYRKNSMILYVLFLMAMMIHVLLALLFFMMIWWALFGDLTGFAWFWVVILVPAYFLLSVLYHYNKITHDDDFLLKDLEVTRLFINISGIEALDVDVSSDDTKRKNHQIIYAKDIKDFEPAYRRYYEFAEQLAIASNLTLPKLYVMNEQGVNAFVAGFNRANTMMVVSKGALELDNEGLYGLIGHEYGHILHGDAKLNIQMYVLMSGLSWLYDVADGLEWLSKWRQNPKVKRFYYQDNRGERQEYVVVTDSGRLSVEFFSLIIRLLGFLGMASSEWIKQHFNRQREFLADATSVQLTRSHGVAKLLQTLERTPYLTQTQKRYTTHLSYFFFLNPHDDHSPLNWRERIGQMGSTHPSIKERVMALKSREYDVFAQMVTHDLDKEHLQSVHDEMMLVDFHKKTTVGDYKTLDLMSSEHHCFSDEDVFIDEAPNQEKTPISIPVYPHELKISDDKVINGRLVVDETWKTQYTSRQMIYPKQAKADYELKNITHVNMRDVANMTLPLIITRHLRNDAVGHDLTELFLLFYAIMFCHDSDGIELADEVYLNDVIGVGGQKQKLAMDENLLKTVAEMDRRIDNGLLLVIYQRLNQDLKREDKRLSLINDYKHLKDFINYYQNKSYKNNSIDCSKDTVNQDGLVLLWRSIHLYRLLVLLNDGSGFYEKSLSQKLNFIHHKYDIIMNEWIMITLMIYMVISHYDTNEYKKEKIMPTIQRLIRLINHKINIDESDISAIINIMKSFDVIDMTLLLLKYHDKSSLTANRYIDTLHTALLSDGLLCERDYEILLTLHQYWCPDDELTLYP